MYNTNIRGPRADPCDTPHCIIQQSESTELIDTNLFPIFQIGRKPIFDIISNTIMF